MTQTTNRQLSHKARAMLRTIARAAATAFAWGLCLATLWALLIVTP